MAIDYESLSQKLLERGIISKEKHAEYLADEDGLPNDVNCGSNVLSLGWDGGFPGNSGAIWVSKWNEFYFFTSSDIDSEGPFESLDEVLGLEWFSVAAANPELDSPTLALDQLLTIASNLVAENGDEIWINGTRYVLKDDDLVQEAADSDDTN